MLASLLNRRFVTTFLLASALSVTHGALRANAQELVVNADKTGGVYNTGEKVLWHLSVKGEGAAAIEKIGYVLRKGGLSEMGRGELTLKEGAADLETKLDEPGTILAEFSITPPGKAAVKTLAAAAIAPSKIAPSAAEPGDFDTFWKSKIEELNTVPTNPILEKGDGGVAGVDYWKVTLDNIRGSKIRGQLAKPAAADGETKKYPAQLIVQWAGVYPLQKGWVTSQAKNGWLTLNITAHDLPIDEPADFYKQQADGALRDYPGIGNDDREKSYFLRMYLSCYRAADYLASRDDWDGKTLVVTGGSQGGLQAIMIAGLHPKITALMANVPAGCDHTGPAIGRQGGWPQWYYKKQGKDAEKVVETSKYYDVVNFARRVKCPALVGVGLIDQTCPPAGIMAAFNLMQGPKELVLLEKGDHGGSKNSHGPYYGRLYQWNTQLAKGQAAPVKANP